MNEDFYFRCWLYMKRQYPEMVANMADIELSVFGMNEIPKEKKDEPGREDYEIL